MSRVNQKLTVLKSWLSLWIIVNMWTLCTGIVWVYKIQGHGHTRVSKVSSVSSVNVWGWTYFLFYLNMIVFKRKLLMCQRPKQALLLCCSMAEKGFHFILFLIARMSKSAMFTTLFQNNKMYLNIMFYERLSNIRTGLINFSVLEVRKTDREMFSNKSELCAHQLPNCIKFIEH